MQVGQGLVNGGTKMKIDIRQARVQDASQIEKIARSLRYDPSKTQIDGFLVYVLSEEEYKQRIKRNPYFYVAESDGGIEGFSMNYNDHTLKTLLGVGAMSHESSFMKFLLEQKNPFILADQIGVRREFARAKIGHALINRLFSDMRKAQIPDTYAGILHKPTRNEASIKFCSELGFENICEISNNDFYLWGIYKKIIQGENYSLGKKIKC